MNNTIILGSASPRRADYLHQLGVCFDCIKVDYDERFDASLAHSPKDLVVSIVQAKLDQLRQVVWPRASLEQTKPETRPETTPCLVADTVVVFRGEILGKPSSTMDAQTTLERLSGQEHSVITALALGDRKTSLQRCVQTQVFFRRLTSAEIAAYIATGEPFNKAGSYGLQGLGGAFVSHIHGSVSAVIGLPLVETLELFNEWGLPHALCP